MSKYTTIWDDYELRWGYGEILEKEHRAKANRLMRLIKSKKPFDTGWFGLKKEIVSVNIKREKKGGLVEISVCEAMDELPYDLLTDADETLTESQIDELWNDDEWGYRLAEISTEVTESEFVRCNASIELVVKKIENAWNNTHTTLHNNFEEVKEIVKEYKENEKKGE